MIKFTQEWCTAMALREDGEHIMAGTSVFPYDTTKESNALSTFVKLMRKKHKMTIDRLAKEADIDVLDVISIEEDPEFRPSVRTIFNIANAFKFSNKNLMQIAGVTEQREEVRHEALKFAACSSGNTGKITKEELAALEQFVAVVVENTKTKP